VNLAIDRGLTGGAVFLGIAMDLMFGLLEDAGEAALSLNDPEKRWEAHYLPAYIDQLSYLLGDVFERVKRIRQARETIGAAAESLRAPDPIEPLWNDSLQAQAAMPLWER
jgi:hypothetical protein